MSFNLHQYKLGKNKRIAIELPNGQTTISLPNGQGPGIGDGVQITDDSGNSLQSNANNPDKIKQIIGDILYESSIGSRDDEKIKNIAVDAINVDIPQEFAGKDDLVKMIAAIGRRAKEDHNKVSVNPDTGEKEQTVEELASSIAKIAGWDIEALIQDAKKRQANNQTSTIEKPSGIPPIRTSKKRTPVETTRDEEFKEEEEEDPVKKKKKGNPFKVLMGIVGKMLDHGMGRRDIVRKITRQEKNKWEQDTIEECIKAVMNARKKENREKKALNNTFNLYRYAKAKKENKMKDVRESIYDIPRDIKLMSTMELISRLAYLHGASNFEFGSFNENNPGNKHLDNTKLSKDLKSVIAELSNRNYDDEQIKILSRTVQGIQTEE